MKSHITVDIAPWSIEQDPPYLLHDGGPWGIPLDRFGTYADLGFWAHHVAGKDWGDNRALASLVRAWEELNWAWAEGIR